MCRDYLRSNRVAASDISERELLSEVWQKLLGTVFLSGDDAPAALTALPTQCSVSPIPGQDGRVVWLIREIGGSGAIAHRYEDIQRQRFGRAVPRRGRPLVQPKNEEPFEIEVWDDHQSLREIDSGLVWRGLLVMATREFSPEEDATKLLHLLAKFPDLFDDSFGSQWPVRTIVTLLNTHFPPPDWRDRHVEDARRRITNWIARLVRKNALDLTDLEAIFAGVAREQQVQSDRTVRPKIDGNTLQS